MSFKIKFSELVFIVAILILVIFLTWWSLQPVSEFPLRGNLDLDKISFRVLQSDDIFEGEKTQRVDILNYEHIAIKTDSILVQNGKGIPIEDERLEITQLEGFGGSGVNFEANYFQGLEIAGGTQISIDLPEDRIPNSVQIMGKNTEGNGMTGSLNYSDSLQLHLNFAELDIAEYPEVMDSESATVFCFTNTGNERKTCLVEFKLVPGGGILAIQFYDSLTYQNQSFLVDTLVFDRPFSGRAISSILGGELIIQEKGAETPFRTIPMVPGDELKLPAEAQVLLQSLFINSEKISVKFSGNFTRGLYGQDIELSRLAPLRIEWYWYAYRIQIIVMGIALLLAILLIGLRMYRARHKEVVFIALSNAFKTPGSYLRKLKEERIAIEGAMRKVFRHVEVKTVPDAGISDIFRQFKDDFYRDRIRIFHFAGHGDQDMLEMEALDGKSESANGRALADYLGRQAELKLVFLNACESMNHAEHLKSAGIKNLILTNKKIDDSIACKFAAAFYENLANGKSLKESFELAEKEVQTYSKKTAGFMRGFIRDSYNEAEDGPPWVGYFEDDWKLV